MLTAPFLIILLLVIMFVYRSLAPAPMSASSWTVATFGLLIFGSVTKTVG